MWLDRKVYEKLLTENAQLRGANQEQVRQIASLQATMDWLTVRVTQIEQERAQLLFNYTGVKTVVPEIQRVPDRGTFDRPDLNALPDFNDVGDEAAARMGLGWNETGEVINTNRK